MKEVLLSLHVEPLAEGGFLATSEDLPGLVAQGRTVAETLENLQFTYNFADGTTPAPVNQFTVPTVPAPGGDNENQIRSVNVYLGARSTTTAATTGKYVRTNLATQVALRSMAYFNTYK